MNCIKLAADINSNYQIEADVISTGFLNNSSQHTKLEEPYKAEIYVYFSTIASNSDNEPIPVITEGGGAPQIYARVFENGEEAWYTLGYDDGAFIWTAPSE